MSDFFKNPSILFSKSEENENTFSLVQFNAHNSFNSRISLLQIGLHEDSPQLTGERWQRAWE